MDDARLDALLAGARGEIDAEIAASGAPSRIRTAALAEAATPFARLPWRRIAAATLVAALLGGAADFAFFSPGDTTDLAMNEPLFAFDLMDGR